MCQRTPGINPCQHNPELLKCLGEKAFILATRLQVETQASQVSQCCSLVTIKERGQLLLAKLRAKHNKWSDKERMSLLGRQETGCTQQTGIKTGAWQLVSFLLEAPAPQKGLFLSPLPAGREVKHPLGWAETLSALDMPGVR